MKKFILAVLILSLVLSCFIYMPGTFADSSYDKINISFDSEENSFLIDIPSINEFSQNFTPGMKLFTAIYKDSVLKEIFSNTCNSDGVFLGNSYEYAISKSEKPADFSFKFYTWNSALNPLTKQYNPFEGSYGCLTEINSNNIVLLSDAGEKITLSLSDGYTIYYKNTAYTSINDVRDILIQNSLIEEYSLIGAYIRYAAKNGKAKKIWVNDYVHNGIEGKYLAATRTLGANSFEKDSVIFFLSLNSSGKVDYENTTVGNYYDLTPNYYYTYYAYNNRISADGNRLVVTNISDSCSNPENDVVKIEGIVTSSDVVSLYGTVDVDTTKAAKATVQILDVYDTTNPDFADYNNYSSTELEYAALTESFLIGKSNISDMVGYRVIMNVVKDASTGKYTVISCLKDTASNQEVSFTIDQFDSFDMSGSKTKLEYYASATDRNPTSLTLDSNLVFVINNIGGKTLSSVQSLLANKTLSGSLTLIGNNSTNGYDVIFVEIGTSAVVDEVNASGTKIYFKDAVIFPDGSAMTNITVDPEETSKLIKITKGGKKIFPAELSEYDVMTIVAANKNADYVEIEVIDTPITGTISIKSPSDTSYTNYAYKVNGTNYNVAYNAYESRNLDIGKSGDFYIDKYGKIAAFIEDAPNINYAYVMGVGTESAFNSIYAQVQLLTEDGVIIFDIESEIEIDGTDYEISTSAAVRNYIDPLYKTIIKYSVNSDGKIDIINTEDGDDFYLASSSTRTWDADNNTLDGYVDENAHVFLINSYKPNKYSIAGDISLLTDGQEYTFKRYDTDETEGAVVLITGGYEYIPTEAEIEKNYSEPSFSYIIETGVSSSFNSLIGQILMLTPDGTKTYNIAEEVKLNGSYTYVNTSASINEFIKPLSGTVIQYRTDKNGNIVTIETIDGDILSLAATGTESWNAENLTLGEKVNEDTDVLLLGGLTISDIKKYSKFGATSDLKDGQEYTFERYKIGNETVVLLIKAGYTPIFDEFISEPEYAYVIETGAQASFNTINGQVRLLTADGVDIYDVAEEVEIDGIDIEINTSSAVTGNISPLVGTLIQYRTDSEGKIGVIETSNGTEFEIASSGINRWDAENFNLGGDVADNAIVFILDDSPGTSSIKSNSFVGTIADLEDECEYDYIRYNTADTDGAVLLIKHGYACVGPTSNIAVITEVLEGVNERKENVLFLSYYQNGEHFSEVVTNEAVYKNYRNTLTIGDIVKLKRNSAGVIIVLAKYVDFADPVRNRKTGAITNTGVSETFNGDEAVAFGYATKYSNSSKSVTLNNASNSFRLSAADNIYVIDASFKTGIVNTGSAVDFEFDSELMTDFDKYADWIFVRKYDGSVKDIVIVKNIKEYDVDEVNSSILEYEAAAEDAKAVHLVAVDNFESAKEYFNSSVAMYNTDMTQENLDYAILNANNYMECGQTSVESALMWLEAAEAANIYTGYDVSEAEVACTQANIALEAALGALEAVYNTEVGTEIILPIQQ